MHSITMVATILAAVATLGSAAPSGSRHFGAAAKRDPTVCAPGTGYYQVCSNGFKGCYRGDACTGSAGVSPDSDDSDVVEPWTPVPNVNANSGNGNSDPTVCAPGTGYFQSCSNGFRGCCKTDACSNSPGLCRDADFAKRDLTVCAPGTGFFQSCSNGFRGCCKSDACTGSAGVCPDADDSDVVKPWTPIPNVDGNNDNGNGNSDPTVCAPGTGFFQVCANGFKGCCKTDACSNSAGLCRDADFAKREVDPTVCAPGTGFYQVCSNGFKGCCATDACSNVEGVCPEAGSPAAPAPVVPVSNAQQSGQYVDPTVCPAGTGYYQVCASGFKGCCKADACTLGYCPQ